MARRRQAGLGRTWWPAGAGRGLRRQDGVLVELDLASRAPVGVVFLTIGAPTPENPGSQTPNPADGVLVKLDLASRAPVGVVFLTIGVRTPENPGPHKLLLLSRLPWVPDPRQTPADPSCCIPPSALGTGGHRWSDRACAAAQRRTKRWCWWTLKAAPCRRSSCAAARGRRQLPCSYACQAAQ